MLLLLVFLPGLYIIWLIVIYIAWKKIPEAESDQEINAKIAVVIPVRNEESGIGQLLSDLDRQDYPSRLIRVHVIDDGSEDSTPGIVRQMQSKVKYNLDYRLMVESKESPARYSRKKEAIAEIVKTTSAGIILQTDGDCRVGTQWISSMVSGFVHPDTHFIAGPVIYYNINSSADQFLQLDISSLGVVSASMIALGIPVMANGANMAYRKDAFITAGGYAGNFQIASGDDTFLMHSIGRKFPDSVKFLRNSAGVVRTAPPGTWREFLHQRIRWAGKWKYHSYWGIKWLAVFIFLVHLDLVGLIGWSVYEGKFSHITILLSLRIFLEWKVLNAYLNFAGMRMSIPAFLTASMLYPLYAVIFGILSNTVTFTWKGRSYSNWK